MQKHFNIAVTGKVQGVFYRQSTLEAARRLGLTGFVRNEANGGVYIEAEGEEHQLKQLVEWCEKGPPRSRVEAVKVTEGAPGHFTSFEVTG